MATGVSLYGAVEIAACHSVSDEKRNLVPSPLPSLPNLGQFPNYRCFPKFMSDISGSMDLRFQCAFIVLGGPLCKTSIAWMVRATLRLAAMGDNERPNHPCLVHPLLLPFLIRHSAWKPHVPGKPRAEMEGWRDGGGIASLAHGSITKL